MPLAKKLFIKTYGCQMNVYDSARMADVLAPLGYARPTAPEDADLVILNTCHIREKATEKVFSELGRLRAAEGRRGRRRRRDDRSPWPAASPRPKARRSWRARPYVDLVLGPQTYHRLPEMVARGQPRRRRCSTRDFPAEAKFDPLPAPRAPTGRRAFLSVQEGCDKFCTFCVVPYTRGAEYSRPAGGDPGRGARAWSPAACAKSRCWARTSTPITARRRWTAWGLGRLIRRPGRDSGPRPHPLHHHPSARHGRRR